MGFRKDMACGTKRQSLVPSDILHAQLAIQMRKQCAPARSFPFQVGAKAISIHRDQNKIGLIREVFRSGFGHLCGGGKMHVAIDQINRRTGGFANIAQVVPFGAAENFEYQHGRVHALRRYLRQWAAFRYVPTILWNYESKDL
jgi:hypothetical protein